MPDKRTKDSEFEPSTASGSTLWHAVLEFLPDPILVLDRVDCVAYCNPAFERIFGWDSGDILGRPLDFVPIEQVRETASGFERLSRDKVLHGFRTRRLTKSGKSVDVLMDAGILDDDHGQAAGIVMVLRDISRQRRRGRSRHILLRMSGALHRFRQLDELLGYVTRLVRVLMRVGGAAVILLDADKREFYFQKASFSDADVERRLKGYRFPADHGAAGQVYRTAKPITIADYARSPYALKAVDAHSQYEVHNLLDVPLRIQDRILGVLRAVNKRDGVFDTQDVELLSAIADVVALPIENARMNTALKDAYDQIRQLYQAKDLVMHYLSHELKTPLAVLSASVRLLDREVNRSADRKWHRIQERVERNLKRLLELEYKLEDVLRDGDDTLIDWTEPPVFEGGKSDEGPAEQE